MTVLQTIQKSTDFLTRKGVESPRFQSESIVAHVLGMPRMQLYLNFQRELSQAQISTCRKLVIRRGNREPLQYLVESVSFCGLEIRVNVKALIPRPETEQLVEHAEAFLRGFSPAAPQVLDLGTGTGCIAIALAVRCPTAQISASDISAEALMLARSNATLHHLQDRIQFFQGDTFAAFPAGARFDLIVCNPPYVASAEIDTLQPEVKDHDPRKALDGGSDGLDFYRLLASRAPAHLTSRGGLLVEFGDGQANSIRKILTSENWIVESPLPDYSGRERFLIARFPGEGARI